MSTLCAIARFVTLASCLALGVCTARAHDVMGSVIYVDLGRTRVHLEIELPVDELRLAFRQTSRPGPAELPAPPSEIADYVRKHLQLESPSGQAFSLQVAPGDVILHDARNWQRIEVEGTPPEHASVRDFVLETDVINHQVVSHHIFVFLRHDLETGQLGEPVYLDTLHYQIHQTHIERARGSLGTGFASVFRLGMAHIAEGSDHLLFVFTLLLPAGLAVGANKRWGRRRSMREAALEVVRVVTAFTVGHSLTLLLGSLGLAQLPAALVESLIAASVVVSATHAVVPIFPGREAYVALAFGLLHGLGFASALHGLGVDGPTLALTVFGFNLGVEAMQALLVLLTLPWLWVLQGTRLGLGVRTLGGLLALVIALAWLAERALGIETPLPGLVDAIFQHGVRMLAALATLALLALVGSRVRTTNTTHG